MSLTKLTKTELQALAEAHDLGFDPNFTKAELVEELEEAGITIENDSSSATRESKKERQARLRARG